MKNSGSELAPKRKKKDEKTREGINIRLTDKVKT